MRRQLVHPVDRRTPQGTAAAVSLLQRKGGRPGCKRCKRTQHYTKLLICEACQTCFELCARSPRPRAPWSELLLNLRATNHSRRAQIRKVACILRSRVEIEADASADAEPAPWRRGEGVPEAASLRKVDRAPVSIRSYVVIEARPIQNMNAAAVNVEPPTAHFGAVLCEVGGRNRYIRAAAYQNGAARVCMACSNDAGDEAEASRLQDNCSCGIAEERRLHDHDVASDNGECSLRSR
eukprot:4182834-Prymnesium_polylepis.2